MHAAILLAGCFPNCTPDPRSGWHTNDGSGAGLGFALILLGFYILLAVKGGGSKGKGGKK